MVADGSVATTTGITASMPMMLTLIEAIAGRSRAESVARELGVEEWNARHASGAFRLTRSFVTTVLVKGQIIVSPPGFRDGRKPTLGRGGRGTVPFPGNKNAERELVKTSITRY
jgi:hypothetical protein